MDGQALTQDEIDHNLRTNNWAFTINNPTDDDRQLLDALADQITYMIIGDEVGENGTPHLQGCLNAKNKISFKQIKKFIPRGHIKKCIKSLDVNISYCMKDAQYKEYGQRPSQGKRTDLLKIKNDILQGKKVDEILLENPEIYHQYGRTLHKIEDIKTRNLFRNFQTTGEWIYGVTGTGKSEYAFKDFHPDTHYVWKYDKDWQDDYNHQHTVIIDEFRGQIPLGYLLTMVDKHPNCHVSRRTRQTTPFLSKHVIITSSMHPQEVYRHLSENDKLDQLIRRMEIKEFEKN